MYKLKNPTLQNLQYLEEEFWRWFRNEHSKKLKTMRRNTVIRLESMMRYAIEYHQKPFPIESLYLQLGVESDGYYRKRVEYCSLHDCFQTMLRIIELKKEGKKIKMGQVKPRAKLLEVKESSQLDMFANREGGVKYRKDSVTD